MASRPQKKLIKCTSTTTTTTTTTTFDDDDSNRSQLKGPNDLPAEVLWKILHEAAILSSVTRDGSVRVFFEVVLTSLSLVCRRWKDVIAHRKWRAAYIKELMAIDPTCQYKRFADAVQVDGIVGHLKSMCVLGDELFVYRPYEDIDVYALESLDVTRKLRTDRPLKLKLKRTLTFGSRSCYDELQSCDANNSLYASDCDDVWRFSPADGQVLAHWTIPNGCSRCSEMSVDIRTGNVAVSTRRWDWGIRSYLLIYSENGRRTKSIDISQLPGSLHHSCVTAVNDSETDADTETESFLLCNSCPVSRAITKFRIQSTDEDGDKIEKAATIRFAYDSQIPFRMQDESGRHVFTMRRSLHKNRRTPLIVYGPNIEKPRYITLNGPRLPENSIQCCLDRARCRLFVTYSPTYNPNAVGEMNDRLVVYKLQREIMKA